MGLGEAVVSALIGVRIGGGLAAARLRPARGLTDRLGDIPRHDTPVTHPVTIHWNEHHMPFVIARTDADAAVGLGVAHAHLRLVQMEVMRRLAWGRTAEMLGPRALALDHGLRILDLPRAVPRILAGLPAWTRAWIEGFAAGVSHMVRTAPLPPEWGALGLAREPWTAADVLAVGRLASADVNWVILFHLLKLRGRADWPELWAALVGAEGAAPAPLGEGDGLGTVATGFTRAGSNVVAVAGSRSASGAALMAADPHLTLALPNLMLVAGVRSPSMHCAGLMIPGLPFVAIGRNPMVAWSGTALQSASTELFDARRLDIGERILRLGARGSRGTEVRLRETRLGPVVSDSPMVGGEPVALKWAGHAPSDEMSAWLGVNRATDWNGFARAAEGMAVPGQNLVYADRRGRVGKLIAARVPRRSPGPCGDVVLDPAEDGAWADPVGSAGLPRQVDPPDGVVVSANECPRHAPVRVGLFFPGHDRHLRLHRLAHGWRLGLDDLAGLQQDVFSEASLDLAGWLARRLDGPTAAALAAWDGEYRTDSRGAALFDHVVRALHHRCLPDSLSAYWASWDPVALLRRRLDALPETALTDAAHGAPRDRMWGEIHRLRLGHMFGTLPGLERLARFTDLPAPGGNDTIHKSAHGLGHAGRHAVRFGACARLLADMADPDANRVVLLGGQDGWPGSATFLDQLDLWRRGQAVPLPLRPETVRATFPHTTVLRP